MFNMDKRAKGRHTRRSHDVVVHIYVYIHVHYARSEMLLAVRTRNYVIHTYAYMHNMYLYIIDITRSILCIL